MTDIEDFWGKHRYNPEHNPEAGGYDESGWGMPRYCRRCGAELRLTHRQTGYSERHGMPDLVERRRCPIKQWRWDGHTDTGWHDLMWVPTYKDVRVIADPPE